MLERAHHRKTRRPQQRLTPDHDLKRQRQARHRARQQRHVIVVPVELDELTIGWLVRLRWIEDKRADDRNALGQAIAALLLDAAQAPTDGASSRR
jgi:hypothetical protein